MTKRDKLKGRTIGRVMARTGCSYAYAETVYTHVERMVLQTALRLAAGMVTHKIRREILGQDLIARN